MSNPPKQSTGSENIAETLRLHGPRNPITKSRWSSTSGTESVNAGRELAGHIVVCLVDVSRGLISWDQLLVRNLRPGAGTLVANSSAVSIFFFIHYFQYC